MKTAVIEAADVSKRFGHGAEQVVALDGVTLQIRQGEIVSLLGSSGCGKSTFLNILAGLLPPTSGKVLIEGEAPRSRREVGLMFQRSLLFPWRTVMQNVMLPAEVMDLPKEESR
ncbi:MAG TPA: ATP-binding cassette domain-containing protein, partial [Acidimicrobiia bacterium]|nr:ATP-binding cassette domain-containing protein [Acidimicrobiia bacterium]